VIPSDHCGRREADDQKIDHGVQELPREVVVVYQELRCFSQHPGGARIDNDDLKDAPATDLLE
jgi:hypothetical protein